MGTVSTTLPGGNSPSVTTSYLGAGYDPYWTPGCGVPVGRVAANGLKPILIFQARQYCSGKAMSPNVRLFVGSAYSSFFTVASAGSAADTGMRALGPLLAYEGNTLNVGVDKESSSSAVYLGRSADGAGGTIVHNSGTYKSTSALSGSMEAYQCPNAPTALAVTADGLDLTMNWTAPSDNGGTAITGYRVEIADNALFTGATVKDIVGTGTSTTHTVTAPGTYYVRVAAKNAVTAAASTWSVFSASDDAEAVSGAYYSDGATFKPSTVHYSDGATWKDVESHYSNASTFVETS